MRLETTLNRLYINAYLTASRRVEKVNNQANGQQEKQKNTKVFANKYFLDYIGVRI